MIQKIKKFTVIVCSLLVLALCSSPAIANAAVAGNATSGSTSSSSSSDLGNGCINSDGSKKSQSDCLTQDPIVHDLNIFVDFLSAGVGIVVAAMIIIGGIQYSLAGGSPDKVKEARKRITNALLAMVAFMVTFAFLQWIIPGGIFS